MFEKLWTKISGYCLFGEGGPGNKNLPKVYQGKEKIEKITFFVKKLGYIAGVWVVKTRLW